MEDKNNNFRTLNTMQVAEIIGCHSQTILNKSNPKSAWHDPSFPKRIVFGHKSVRWNEAEIIKWIESKKRDIK
jgi:prophage regulatory protein